MYKKLLIYSFFLIAIQGAFARETNVKVFDKVTIVTDPSKGVHSYFQWGIFPNKEESIRKVVMNLTLAHPENIKIAHWDYLDHINILRQGGVNGDTINMELGRMLTPYGGHYKEDWSFSWSVDVTDFQAILRDSVELEYIHSGYESNELGWDLTIDFEITYGPQVANFISVQKMWNGQLVYGNPEDDIENHLKPIQINRVEGAAFGRFRIQHTGHGMDDPAGCSEFCSRWRELLVDNKVVDHRNLWKECGNNPLYPQAGTWIYDRGNWCPGDLQSPDIIDVPFRKKQLTFDLNMEPYTAKNIQQPKEQIRSYLFQYAAPNHKNDVALEEVMAPNNHPFYNRLNPRGFSPMIKIRNLGSRQLTHLDIVYFTEGFQEKIYSWDGNLGFYESATLTLPGEIDAKTGINTFMVMLDAPNGKEDEWSDDNSMSVTFESVPAIPSSFVVDFLTNNTPKDNHIFVVNSNLDTVYSKSPEMLEPATQYSDTLHLPEGNYFLQLTDSAGNGLEFWADPNQGFGRLRLMDTTGIVIHAFEGDCGNGQFYAFRADETVKMDPAKAYLTSKLYPRSIDDFSTFYMSSNKDVSVKLIVLHDNDYVEAHEYKNVMDEQLKLDFRRLKPGKYSLKVFVDNRVVNTISFRKND